MLRRTRAGAARLVFAATFTAAVTAAVAQNFPGGKQIEMTVMFGAGSAAGRAHVGNDAGERAALQKAYAFGS